MKHTALPSLPFLGHCFRHFCLAEIAAGVHSKLFADAIIRRNIVVAVSLAKRGISGKGACALDAAYLKQYSPDDEINVKQIKRTQLRAQVQLRGVCAKVKKKLT